MRWGLIPLTIAVGGVVGYQFYATAQNTIHGLTGPRFNLAVKNTEPLAEIDLAGEIQGFDGYRMRGRYVIVQPGATIRIHDHVGRPAFSYIVNTTVDQFRSDESGPLHMKPGDLSADTNISHWWRNTGGYPLTFYVVDIYQPAGNKGE
ncbi:MAG: cupin domain-containing protein [Parvularculaceae bacterium]